MHLTDRTSKIFVAGHRGLVGSALVRRLIGEGYTNLVLRSRNQVDLCNQEAVTEFFETEKPDFVLMAAARVGGIVANSTYPAEFLYDNLAIQTNVIQAAFEHEVKRFIFLGSTCIYPRLAEQPVRETSLLTGPLETTNEWYAIAKIAGLKHCEALHRQYGVDFLSLMPTNLYGPGDNFDLENSHVLPALIRKFHEALPDNKPVELWGSGSPKREFLHVDDLASACFHVLKTEESVVRSVAPDGLINVGYGEDLTILELAEKVRSAVGSTSEIVLDGSRPDGTPRKWVDVGRLFSLGWRPTIDLDTGLRMTYEWYLDQFAS